MLCALTQAERLAERLAHCAVTDGQIEPAQAHHLSVFPCRLSPLRGLRPGWQMAVDQLVAGTPDTLAGVEREVR